MTPMRCPCRKKTEITTYASCCEPYHLGHRVPPTAETLMRSRYSAFALEKRDYLLATWHARTRPATLDFMPNREWMLLRVLAAATDGAAATVEFTARSRLGGRTHLLHEISRFMREDGRWFYVDGIVK